MQDRRPLQHGTAQSKMAATRALLQDIPWREITGMRYRLIHGYAEVRLDLVWIVATDRLGPLMAVLERIVQDGGDEAAEPDS